MEKIKINLASAKELEALPGVGPAIAKRIVRERSRNGDFSRGSQLKDVKGLDDEKVNDFKGLVNFERSQESIEGLIESTIKTSFWNIVDGAYTDIKDWFEANPKLDKRIPRKKSTLSFPKRRTASEPILDLDYGHKHSNVKKITNNSINKIAQIEDIDAAAIHAVIEVESSGAGYLKNGNPKILFEGHVFWRELKANRMNPEQYLEDHSDILYPHWNKRHYRGGMGEYDRLNKAVRIHKECALRSTSWGMFQIMGFNFRAAGYPTVESFVKSNYISEEKQLESFIKFVKSKHLIAYIQNRDWANFAKGYNGNGYKANRYDLRLSSAYQRHKESSLA